jgi:hypothetical protein
MWQCANLDHNHGQTHVHKDIEQAHVHKDLHQANVLRLRRDHCHDRSRNNYRANLLCNNLPNFFSPIIPLRKRNCLHNVLYLRVHESLWSDLNPDLQPVHHILSWNPDRTWKHRHRVPGSTATIWDFRTRSHHR